MTFVQLIEYETDRPEEVNKVFDEWMKATEGKRTVMHEMHGQDRDKPTHFVDIVEFPSYEAAMQNDKLPETKQGAEKVRSLCTSEPRFVNLEIQREEIKQS